MLELARIYLFVFGVLTIAGGVMGFVKAKSKPSLIAGGISLSIEFFQVFTHNRIPSTTDVLCDTIGAGLGGYLANTCRALLVTEPVRPLGIEAAGPRIPR